jgi:hypothetical protein
VRVSIRRIPVGAVGVARAPALAADPDRRGSPGPVPAYLAFFGGLLALSWIDVEWIVLPRAIVYPVSALMGVLLLIPAGAYGAWHSYGVAWGFACGWFLFFYLLWS